MTYESRRSLLKKMQEHPRSVELSELILERMPMDVLTWIAPIVLEQINEDGYSNFDAMTSPPFCRTFLNRHYKRDTILELVGKELEAEIKSKPDRLSDVMKIVQKRHDMKYNKKKLEQKATIEFKSSDEYLKCDARFGRSFVFAWERYEPQGLDLGAARSHLLLFKINRENEERSPKFELVDYDPCDPQQNPQREPLRPILHTAFLPPLEGVFLDSVVLSPNYGKRLFFPDEVTTEIVKGKKILLECDSLEQMDFNFSRQRSWRDYVTNPKSVVPMMQEADLFAAHSSGDKEEISPFEKRVVDFWNFSGGKQQVVRSFDFTQRKEDKYWCTDARFIDENNWLIFARSERYDHKPPGKVYHIDLKTETVTLYEFPRIARASFPEDPGLRQYGIFEDLIFYSRYVEYKEEEDDQNRSFFVLGHLMKNSRKRRFDPDLFNNLCFLKVQKQKDHEIELKIGNNGFVHLVSSSSKNCDRLIGEPIIGDLDVFTFTIEDIKQRILKAPKRSLKINEEDDEETTLPTINLEDFRVPEYRDHSENLHPGQSDVGYVEGNKYHFLV